jgi:hypothetical protein
MQRERVVGECRRPHLVIAIATMLAVVPRHLGLVTTPTKLHGVVEHRGDGDRLLPRIAVAIKRSPLRAQALFVELARVLCRPVAEDREATFTPIKSLDGAADLDPDAVTVAELLAEHLLVGRDRAERRAQARLLIEAPGSRLTIDRCVSRRVGWCVNRRVSRCGARSGIEVICPPSSAAMSAILSPIGGNSLQFVISLQETVR